MTDELSMKVIQDHLSELSDLAARVSGELGQSVGHVADRVLATFANGGKIMFCGNGGSAADAQHLAAPQR